MQKEHEVEQNLMKVIVVGDAHVGKSSLITRYFDNKFGNSVQTIGVDFRVKEVKVITGKSYQVSIWDTAGQEQFKSIVRFSCKGADGAIICFDLASKSSLDSVPGWVEYLRKHCPEHLSIVLVGTKSDLTNQMDEQVITEATSQFKFFKTSSKTHQNVESTFNYIFDLCAQERVRMDEEIKVEEVGENVQSRTNSKAYKLSSLHSNPHHNSQVNKKNNEESNCC